MHEQLTALASAFLPMLEKQVGSIAAIVKDNLQLPEFEPE